MPMPYSFNDYRFTMQFRITKYDASCFLLLSQNGFGYLGVFGFSIYFRIVFSTDVKNDFGILTGIVLSLQMLVQLFEHFISNFGLCYCFYFYFLGKMT